MKRLSLLLMVIMLVLGWSRWGGSQGQNTTDHIQLLLEAMAECGGQPLTGELYSWAVLPEEATLRRTEELIETIARALGVTRHQYELSVRSNGKIVWGEIETDLQEGGYFRLSLSSQGQNTGIEARILQCPPEKMGDCYRALETGLLAVGLAYEKVKITTCFEGLMNARLSNSEKLDLIYRVFKVTDTTYRGAIEGKGVSQWFGWSPRFKVFAETEKGSVNLGVSLRRDSQGTHTIIRVATPVLP